jgi:hypothetical protein
MLTSDEERADEDESTKSDSKDDEDVAALLRVPRKTGLNRFYVPRLFRLLSIGSEGKGKSHLNLCHNRNKQ